MTLETPAATRTPDHGDSDSGSWDDFMPATTPEVTDDWSKPIEGSFDDTANKLRTPDVPVRRSMGRRILDKIMGRQPKLVSHDDAKAIMFTDESWNPGNPDTVSAIHLENSALNQAHAENATADSRAAEQQLRTRLEEQRAELIRLQRAAAHVEGSGDPRRDFLRRQEANSKVEDQQAYVSKLESQLKSASSTHEAASTASYNAGRTAELDELANLEMRKSRQ